MVYLPFRDQAWKVQFKVRLPFPPLTHYRLHLTNTKAEPSHAYI